MKVRGSSRHVKRKKNVSHDMIRCLKNHFAIVIPVLVLMVLMTGAYFGFRQGSYFVRHDDKLLYEARSTEATEKETSTEHKENLHMGLDAMVHGILTMQEYSRASRILDTSAQNEKVLVGALGVNRVEKQRERMGQGVKEAAVWYEKARQLVLNNQMPSAEYYTLLKIVEAEATGEDFEGKRLIANVILNRVRDTRFPDTIEDVVWQQEGGAAQFQPTVDGRIDTVEISDDTIKAVDQALQGVDESHGALFFMARSASDESNVDWFDENLSRLFAHGGHEYFTFSDSTVT